jgi:DNA-binding beta-propeller fold protein YncE
MSWPKPPAAARIELVRVIADAEDLGIEPGLWDRFVGLLAGTQRENLVRPSAPLMTEGEVLYLADPGRRAVHRFDVGNRRHLVIRGTEDVPFVSPVGLAQGPNQSVFVSDSGLGRVFVIEPSSANAREFPVGRGLGQPTGIAADLAQGRLYVVDTARHQVLAFGLDGRFLFEFGGRGNDQGQFNYPTFIWHDARTASLWITDSLNFRVQRFDPTGRYLDGFGEQGDATGRFSRPKGIATDSQGHVYVMDALHHNLQVFDPSGSLLLHVGEQGGDFGQFWLPSALSIDDRDRIFVADAFNRRIQVFRYLSEQP